MELGRSQVGSVKKYVENYFNRARPHRRVWQRRPVAKSQSVRKVRGKVVSIPILDGLCRDDQCAA